MSDLMERAEELRGLWAAVQDGNAGRTVDLFAWHPRLSDVVDHLHPCSPYSPFRLTPLLAADDVGVTWSPLLWASWRGYADIVTLLLGHGAEADQRDVSGETPLILAARQGYCGVAEILLNNGADPDGRLGEPAQDGDEWETSPAERGPLHWAALRGDAALATLLLAHKATADLADADGQTPLHLAAQRNRVEAAKVLLAAGADPMRRNHDGATVLGVAMRTADGFGGPRAVSARGLETVLGLLLDLNPARHPVL